jgi:aristolochene synthase
MKALDLLTTYAPLSLLYVVSLLVIVQPYSFLFLWKMTIHNATIPSSTAAFVRNEAPQTIFRAQIHRNEQEVTAEINDYFLKHWPFENEKARMKFVAVGFSRVTCYYFPLALDDRIALACRLITLLFLIDGM